MFVVGLRRGDDRAGVEVSVGGRVGVVVDVVVVVVVAAVVVVDVVGNPSELRGGKAPTRFL